MGTVKIAIETDANGADLLAAVHYYSRSLCLQIHLARRPTALVISVVSHLSAHRTFPNDTPNHDENREIGFARSAFKLAVQRHSVAENPAVAERLTNCRKLIIEVSCVYDTAFPPGDRCARQVTKLERRLPAELARSSVSA